MTVPPFPPPVGYKVVNSSRRGIGSKKSRSWKLAFKSKSGKPRAFLNEAGLYEYAVKALGRQMRTTANLRSLMQQRVESGEQGESTINAVLAHLKEHGYLDDAAFAETYTRLRKENEKFGQRRVQQDLRNKGVPTNLIAPTVDAAYAQTNEETLARQHLERKRMRKPQNEKETARIMRRLVGAGFSTGVIYKILRQWDVPDESLAALDNLREDPHEE
jgi:regulatory protein